MIRKEHPTNTATPRRGGHKPATAADTLRFVPVGGLEEVGRNMMFFEYQDEIVLIDAGIQFPEEETPGVDFIIPNVSYLESKKHNIRGLILSHAHFDHVGAIPYLIEKLGNPIIYTTDLTKAMVERRQEEFRNAPKLRFQIVKHGDRVPISKHFTANFFEMAHTIPDTIGVSLETPVGNMVHYADFRIDYDENGKPQGLDHLESLSQKGVHTLFIDSTNADKEGFSMSEKTVEMNLQKLFEAAEGRIILATFSSMISRIAEIIAIAERLGRVVAINGRSMKENINIAQNLGYIKAKKGQLIPVEEVHKHRDNKILILTTGAQGQENAGLMRIANGDHRHVSVKAHDTIIFSSSVIPGNERSVQNLKDTLARQGAIVYQNSDIDIHSSGHAPKDELIMVIKLTKPKFLVPIHGHYFKRAANCKNGQLAGMPKENTFLPDNGHVAELTKETFVITKETIPAFYVMVDGLGVGDVEEVVLRDRLVLAQEGMVVIIASFNKTTGRLLKNPDIISRGFIYLKENKEILEEVRRKIKGLLARIPEQRLDADYLKTLIRDQIGQFLFTKTHRRPMVLPVVIEL